MENAEGQSQARVTGGGLVGTAKAWARFLVVHDDWEGFLFAITVRGEGEIVAFEMYGDGPAAARDDVRVARAHGVAQPLEAAPVAEAIPLTARRIREVPFRELFAAVQRRMSGADGVHGSPWLRERLTTLESPRKQGVWTEHELARLCADYVALVELPDRTPLVTLADRRFLSAKYVRNLISGVRGDLITHSPAGRAGGQLTDKAKEVLSGDDKAKD